MTLISASELGAVCGITGRQVNSLAQRGHMIRLGDGYHLEHSVKAYCAFLRAAAQARGGDSAAAAADQRARLARAQADLAETKNAVLRRELVPASEVEAEWSGILRTVRAGLLAVPSRCATRLSHLTAHDLAEIDAEVRSALTQLGDEGEQQHG